MDQLMVDVTDIPEVCEGDEVILMGRDKTTGEEITAEFLGEESGRFNYELTCDINHRVPRAFEY
jgi:alanine racemase